MRKIKSPIFLVNPKSYLYGEKSLELALAADRCAERTGVTVIFTCPFTDIRMIKEQTKHIVVAAQHMDPLRPGRGMGFVLPESLKEAGADAVFLNHAEHPVTLDDLSRSIIRAHELEMDTVVLVDTAEEGAAAAMLGADVLLCEPTSLIGTGIPADIEYTLKAVEIIHKVSRNVSILICSGISKPEDVYNVLKAGADGSGCTSGIVCAQDPVKMMNDMVDAVIAGINARK